MSPKAYFIVGTTASGKSDWALQMAEETHGVIFNCDSIQLYKHLEIGSAQPTAEQKARVPHHLFAYVEPPTEMTAGTYRRDHMELLAKTKDPVFVVGGTGFYFQALERGMYSAPAASPEIQEQIEATLSEEDGEDILWNELHEKDPRTSEKIHKHDHYRLVRAIELIRREGKTLSEIREQLQNQPVAYPRPYLKLGIRWTKEQLEERVKERTRKMIEGGIIEETKVLLDQGLGNWSPLQSVGYDETVTFLTENKTQEWLYEEIVRSTLRLAKKQRTWFQRDKDIKWFDGLGGYPQFQDEILKFLADT
jgi:tRNA dimethylallyltransferase